MNVAAYLQLDRDSTDARYEFIDGNVTMLAGGTLDHAQISTNIISSLHTVLRGTPCRVYTSNARVQLSESRYVYPDVTVTCDEQDRGGSDTIRHPRLIVEVLSPNTANYDRGQKFLYYRVCPDIQEYVLVDTQQPLVELFRREKQTLWTLHIFSRGDTITLTSIGMSLPVNAFYEGITFEPHEHNTV